MWSDNEADVDLLGFHHLEAAVLSIIQDDSLLPATIGVFGDWGSGKSTLMRMVGEKLAKDESVLMLSFDGWLFEDYEDAKTALMGSIIDEIVARRTLGPKAKETAKRLGLKLLNKLQVFRLLRMGFTTATAYAVGGPSAAGAVATLEGSAYVADQIKTVAEGLKKVEGMDVTEVEEALKADGGRALRQSIREFREEFGLLLKETDVKTLVVLIDDLDRCMPDTIIETLEAIKLFLFVPRTAFVIGADERLVQYAVRRRFPELPGEKAEVGKDYLEKLVQYPVRVPPLGRAEMETYINLLFTKKANVEAAHFEAARKCVTECNAADLLEVRYNHGIAQKIMRDKFPPELAENLGLAQRIAPILAVGLTGNPRQCKRFLNTLMMRIGMAQSRGIVLKPAVLAKLMILERFYTESYKQLAKTQAEQAGKPVEIAVAEEAFRRPNEVVEPAEDGPGESARPKKGKQHDTETEIPEWLADPSLKEWLTSEPPLAGVDLRPYFYFSRDTLGPLASAIQRMTPAAQEILAALFQPGQAQLRIALKRAAELGAGDAGAVLQALAERTRTADDPGQDDSALWRLLDWVNARRELLGQTMVVLGDLVETDLPVSLPPRVAQLAKAPEEVAMAKRVLEKWGHSTVNDGLKNAALAILKRL